MMETALVVDADFLMRGYAVESLQREDVFVLEASSAEEARRLQASQRFDLVFADLEIFKEGKGFKLDSETIHIVMTSFRTVEKAIQLVGNGAYDYIVKPFSAEQVSVIVSRTRELTKMRIKIALLEKEMGQPSAAFADPQSKMVTELPSEQSSTTNLHDLERQTIIRVLHETRGRRGVMAELLGISVRTLRNKLTQYKNESLLQMP